MMILLSELLQCLVECSEKAAKIAQIFREEHDLFQLLIQEKTESESNKRFVQDFKTLADVLVQETIKKDVGEKFPKLVSQIRGEEQNCFENSQGESIDVVLTDSSEDTVSMLIKVLDGRENVAKVIANIVHSTDIICEKQCCSATTCPVDKLGIWIDPIDSTAEFIEGNYDETEECGIKPYGLNCVCVLIGVYDLETFSPVLGVVNQPFYSRISEEEGWESQYYWGINYCDESCASSSVHAREIDELKDYNYSDCRTPEEKSVIVISSSENAELKEIMQQEYKLVNAAGAGYKALLVAIQNADLYILSKSTTYFWDTCGPHAILNAIGAGMLRLKMAINDHDTDKNFEFLQKWQVKYEATSSRDGTEAFQNHEGIIAYRDPHVVLKFLSFLKSNGYVAR